MAYVTYKRGYETVIGEGIFMPQDRRNGNNFALEMTVKSGEIWK